MVFLDSARPRRADTPRRAGIDSPGASSAVQVDSTLLSSPSDSATGRHGDQRISGISREKPRIRHFVT
jgi:hypothetical protein